MEAAAVRVVEAAFRNNIKYLVQCRKLSGHKIYNVGLSITRFGWYGFHDLVLES